MKKKKIEVKEGNITIPIYVFSDGRFCVDTMLGEKRKRITRTSLEAAKLEARRVIAQIAAGRQHEEPLSLAEAEDYRLAKERLAPFKVSLLTAIEEWIAGRSLATSLIAERQPPTCALISSLTPPFFAPLCKTSSSQSSRFVR